MNSKVDIKKVKKIESGHEENRTQIKMETKTFYAGI